MCTVHFRAAECVVEVDAGGRAKRQDDQVDGLCVFRRSNWVTRKRWQRGGLGMGVHSPAKTIRLVKTAVALGRPYFWSS